jgi:sialic acid synthase SpsE
MMMKYLNVCIFEGIFCQENPGAPTRKVPSKNRTERQGMQRRGVVYLHDLSDGCALTQERLFCTRGRTLATLNEH